MTNLATALVETSKEHGDRPALRLDDQVVTYERFLDAARGVAGLLRARGVEPGARVGMVFPNVPAFPIVFYGAVLAGCVVVPMNPLFKRREIEYYLEDSGASMLWSVPSEEAVEGARERGVPLRTLGASSGALAEALGWTGFFLMTTAAALPAMGIMLFLLWRLPPAPAPAAEPVL